MSKTPDIKALCLRDSLASLGQSALMKSDARQKFTASLVAKPAIITVMEKTICSQE